MHFLFKTISTVINYLEICEAEHDKSYSRKLVENVFLSFEGKHISLAVLSDLTKAYDCISNVTLTHKLSCYGIMGRLQ